MKRLSRILVVTSACFTFSGCTDMAVKMATSQMDIPDSQFVDISIYDADKYKNYLQRIKPFSKKITTDKAGEWYVDVDDDYALVCSIDANYNQSIKNSLNNGKGLLQPVMVISKDGSIEPDWKKTELLRSALISRFKLDILDISVSRKYHEQFIDHLRNATEKNLRKLFDIINRSMDRTLLSTMTDISKAQSDIQGIQQEMAEKNTDYVNSVILKKIPFKPSYIIETSSYLVSSAQLLNDAENFGKYYVMFKEETARKYPQVKFEPHQEAESLKQLQTNYFQTLKTVAVAASLQTSIEFKPFDYYSNITQAGYSLVSHGVSCNLASINAYLKQRKEMGDMMGVGAISWAMNENSKSWEQKRMEAGDVVRKAIESRSSLEGLFFDRVVSAFNAYKISGRVKSQSLDATLESSDGKSVSSASSPSKAAPATKASPKSAKPTKQRTTVLHGKSGA